MEVTTDNIKTKSPEKCIAITENGTRCNMWSLKDSQYCFAHDPDVAVERDFARHKGGKRTRTPHAGDENTIPSEFNTVEDAKQVLLYALAELLPMSNTPGRARLLLQVHSELVKSLEMSDLEKRLQALEAKL